MFFLRTENGNRNTFDLWCGHVMDVRAWFAYRTMNDGFASKCFVCEPMAHFVHAIIASSITTRAFIIFKANNIIVYNLLGPFFKIRKSSSKQTLAHNFANARRACHLHIYTCTRCNLCGLVLLLLIFVQNGSDKTGHRKLGLANESHRNHCHYTRNSQLLLLSSPQFQTEAVWSKYLCIVQRWILSHAMHTLTTRVMANMYQIVSEM